MNKLLHRGLITFTTMMLGLVSLSVADNSSSITPIAQSQYVNGIVAIVNNDVITNQDLLNLTTQTINQAKAQNLPVPDTLTVEQHVLHTLIMQKIAMQLATLNNITVSDDQVNQAINQVAQQNNMTVPQLYAKLASQGIDQTFYFNSIRTQMIVQRLEQAEIAGAIIITPNQIDDYLAAQARVKNAGVQYNIAHILIALPENPTADDYAQAKAKATEVMTRINDGMDFSLAAETYSDSSDAATGGDLGYETVNQLPTAFIEPVTTMKVGEVVGPISTDSGFNIIKLMGEKGGQDEGAHFITEYHIQSILIKTSPIMNSTEAQAQLQRIKLALMNGKSFAEEARAYSEDYFTNQNGGDMGWVNPTKLNPILMSYVQSAPVDQVSNPIQTPDGWYLLKVLGTRNVDDTVAYERQQAEQALFQQKANEALLAWQAQIRSASYVKILDPKLILPSDIDDSSS